MSLLTWNVLNQAPPALTVPYQVFTNPKKYEFLHLIIKLHNYCGTKLKDLKAKYVIQAKWFMQNHRTSWGKKKKNTF